MLSGIVYFEEILEGVKDGTGITNLYPYYEKIRRWILDAENDIAAGGLIVRKKRTYINGDGFYDASFLKLPYDLMGEYSEFDFNTVNFRGDKLEIINKPGPDEIDLIYMGLLLDSNSNPITTRNHKDAVIARCLRNLYAPKMFLGVGNKNLYDEYKDDYNNLVMSSRGNDAFPTKKEWEEIGKTLSMSYADVIMDCGMSSINIDLGGDGNELKPLEQPILTVDMVTIFNNNLT